MGIRIMLCMKSKTHATSSRSGLSLTGMKARGYSRLAGEQRVTA
jgi:hypothetical protein